MYTVVLTNPWAEVHTKDSMNEHNEAKAPHDLQQQKCFRQAARNLMPLSC